MQIYGLVKIEQKAQGKNAETILALKMAGSELVRHVILKSSPEDYAGRAWVVADLARRMCKQDYVPQALDKKLLKGYGVAPVCTNQNIVSRYISAIRDDVSARCKPELLKFETGALIDEVNRTAELAADNIEGYQ